MLRKPPVIAQLFDYAAADLKGLVMLRLEFVRQPLIIVLLLAGCLCSFFVEALEVGRKWNLLPPGDDRGDRIRFGQSVCASSDGKRFVVGANGYGKYRGVVYVYDLTMGTGNRAHHWRRKLLQGRSTISAEHKKRGELRLVEKGSGFGFACALDLSGDTLAISAPGHDLQRGAVFVFKFNKSKRKWVEVACLEGPQRRNGDSFGWTVVMSGSGDRIVIGAKGRRANNGEVYVFDQRPMGGDDETSYELSERIQPPDFTNESGPNGIRIRNNFGVSLSMSHAGDLLAVGCTGFRREQGAVYVIGLGARNQGNTANSVDDASSGMQEFKSGEDGLVGNWEILQRLEATAPLDFGFFGYKLSMDASGSTIAVGADGEEEYRGSVYIFERCDSKTNSTIFCTPPVQLRAPEPKAEDNFGGSVSISGNGKILVVGSPGASVESGEKGGSDHGALHIYERQASREQNNSTWAPVGHEVLGKDMKRGNAFYAWDASLSFRGDLVLATSPDYERGSGLVTVSQISGLPPIVDDTARAEAGGMMDSVLKGAHHVLAEGLAGGSGGQESAGRHEDL